MDKQACDWLDQSGDLTSCPTSRGEYFPKNWKLFRNKVFESRNCSDDFSQKTVHKLSGEKKMKM